MIEPACLGKGSHLESISGAERTIGLYTLSLVQAGSGLCEGFIVRIADRADRSQCVRLVSLAA